MCSENKSLLFKLWLILNLKDIKSKGIPEALFKFHNIYMVIYIENRRLKIESQIVHCASYVELSLQNLRISSNNNE